MSEAVAKAGEGFKRKYACGINILPRQSPLLNSVPAFNPRVVVSTSYLREEFFLLRDGWPNSGLSTVTCCIIVSSSG